MSRNLIQLRRRPLLMLKLSVALGQVPLGETGLLEHLGLMACSGTLAGAGLARRVAAPPPNWRKRRRLEPAGRTPRAASRGVVLPIRGGEILEDWVAPRRPSAPLEGWKPPRETGLSRTARAKQRLQSVPTESRAKRQGLTFLERASLRRTLPRYEALWADFGKFARKHGVKLNSVEAIDQAGADFLNARYFEGDQPDVAGYLAATIRKFEPKVVRAGRGALAKTLSAARGFRNLCPAQTKQPLPWEAACLITEQLCQNGQANMGLAVVLAFALYLRANEMLLCQVNQLTPPLRGGGKAHKSWCLVLHPSERGQRSKVGLSDEAMRIEGDEFKFLTPILKRWLRNRGREEPLFRFGYTELSRPCGAKLLFVI